MSWITVLTAALTVVAAARVTRLVTTDSLTQPIRDRLERGGRFARWLHQLTSCDWCAGVWVSALAAAAHWFWNDDRLYLYVVFALAAAYTVGLLKDWADSPPPAKTLNITPTSVNVVYRQDPRQGP